MRQVASKTMPVLPRRRHNLHTGGDAGMIVATYQIGNTVIKINDACLVQTPEERERLDIEIATIAYTCLEDDQESDEFAKV